MGQEDLLGKMEEMGKEGLQGLGVPEVLKGKRGIQGREDPLDLLGKMLIRLISVLMICIIMPLILLKMLMKGSSKMQIEICLKVY